MSDYADPYTGEIEIIFLISFLISYSALSEPLIQITGVTYFNHTSTSAEEDKLLLFQTKLVCKHTFSIK